MKVEIGFLIDTDIEINAEVKHEAELRDIQTEMNKQPMFTMVGDAIVRTDQVLYIAKAEEDDES